MGLTAVPSIVTLPATTEADLAAVVAAAAAQPKRDYMSNAKSLISGGGVLSVDSGYNIKWSLRFLVMGAGRGATTATNGHFSIVMPPVGTVIPRVGDTAPSSVTVTSAGINFNAWDALYYILPLGSSEASLPANFRIVQYTSDFVVPYDWLPIATRNSTETPETIQWANGISMTPWVQPALANGWLHYAAPYGPMRWRKINGMVVGNGLAASGTVSTTVAVFTMPVGFRPAVNEILTAGTSPLAGAPYYSEIRVRLDGSVMFQTGVAGYFSLANMNYLAEA